MSSFLDWPPAIVVATCAIAGFGPGLLLTWLASRLSANARKSWYSDVGSSTIGIVALLFGLFSAFLANDIWVRNQTAQQAVIDEGEAIRNLARLSEAVDDKFRLELRDALVNYTDVVLEREWPLMAKGKRADLLAEVRAISNLVVSKSVAQNAGPAVQAKILDAFVQVREKRQVRVILAENRKFTIKWHGMALFGLLTQFAIAITHLNRPKAMLLAQIVFGTALSACLSILLTHEFPFSALNPISSEPLQTAMATLMR